ncbi:phosphatidate cytidylyltransferase [Bacilli bacterium PM5-3]|nr:phosphatidate cytidylyltransferase [Bacilli bacterium PM5-3]MDH6603146.1 phosphatidate cytidylyltransferase [Bacilli bacterium PM5-9]
MKIRVITALAILGVLIPIIYLSPLMFKIMALVIVAIATHEILDVKKAKNYLLLTKILLYVITLLPLILIKDFTQINIIFVVGIIVSFIILMLIDKNIDFNDMTYLFCVSLFIIIASNSAMYLRNLDNGFYIIIFTILVTAASDTGAFFAGSAFGKHKLIPRISPNKTVEGLVGGVVLAVIIGVLYSLFLPSGFDNISIVIIVSIIFGFMAAVGDLFFSAIKRSNNIKDFSNMLPGHGGILDRIDSHLMNLIMCFALICIF